MSAPNKTEQVQQPLLAAQSLPATKKESAKVVTKSTEMSLDEKIAEVARLQAEIAADSIKEFEKDINFIVARAKAQRRKLVDYIASLFKLLPAEEKNEARELLGIPGAEPKVRKQRAPNGTPKPEKEFKDKDSSGARPVAGTTYVLGSEVWNKKVLGAVPKAFKTAVTTGGKLWKDLVKK